jgi:hypothetical protein
LLKFDVLYTLMVPIIQAHAKAMGKPILRWYH